MMKLKVTKAGEGFHPEEITVRIVVKEGEKTMLLDRRSIEDDFIEVGTPIQKLNGHSLVELPRETTQGEWRVWVPNGTLREVRPDDLNRP